MKMRGQAVAPDSVTSLTVPSFHVLYLAWQLDVFTTYSMAQRSGYVSGVSIASASTYLGKPRFERSTRSAGNNVISVLVSASLR
jgi:hypothetical protein